MPSHPCRHPTCCAFVTRPARYCPAHQAEDRREQRDRDRFYDQYRRDPAAKAFYNSAAWQRARAAKLAAEPVCERCRRVFAQHVHHQKPLRDCTPVERLDPRNLKSLCQPCHNEEEAETASRR